MRGVLSSDALHDACTQGGVGGSPIRPDALPKVRGEFAYASDLSVPGMLWGATRRSAHCRARITSLDVSAALDTPGVHAVLTSADVPGVKHYGIVRRDQPVLAIDEVRYQGEPIALVAADHPRTARLAAERIRVDFEVLEPTLDARSAIFGSACPAVHQSGNLVRHQPVRAGDVSAARARAEVVVTGTYEVGMQDQAFLGPESGLAVPADDGGVELYVATQWLHGDLAQVAPCLGLAEDKVRMTLAGVGGAFGGREDLSMQIHAAMLALRTSRPVKIVYERDESFFGHAHRHPAWMRYELGARRDGKLVFASASIVFDGGAYTSSTPNVVANAASLALGPYEVPNIEIDAYGAFTNNPPCGAMRGFGAVQTCFAYESMMDKLASACGLGPVEVRLVNAAGRGAKLATGQIIDSQAPLADMLTRLRELPQPSPRDPSERRDLPGGLFQATRGEGVVRGVGYGVGIKNICFSEGFDDYSTARVSLRVINGEPVASVHTAAAEVGQGLVTLQQQIVRTELGVEAVSIHVADTAAGDAGSSSASRQSYMTGGAVKLACEAVRDAVVAMVRERFAAQVPVDATLASGALVSASAGLIANLADLLGDEVIERTHVFHHRPTAPMDPVTGQGDTHVQLAVCVHRAVVDVDTELGLVKVVELTALQDVGRIMNRQALEGQIHGASAQGLGLALMEEMVVVDGTVRNPSFTDYLIPTAVDVPPMCLHILEYPDPRAPYGLRGAGEPPTLSATPAVVAAVRNATGAALTRVPVRPDDIVLPAGPQP
ncbi:MAG TPA: molybdopterin cofactor-binding domain-containing protein [Streptosporangiaceae bacterium]|nr:molybdopterin cofactor-binding domain-containing protein [Streptosporangiaceae bacterium]